MRYSEFSDIRKVSYKRNLLDIFIYENIKKHETIRGY